MKEKLVLYNFFNNGDIFYSRILIEMLKDYFDFQYYHNQPGTLFHDVKCVQEIHGVPRNFQVEFQNTNPKIINTWIGQNNLEYLNKTNQGCTFENYTFMYKQIIDSLNLKVEFSRDFFPKIYFENLFDYERIFRTMNQFKLEYEKIIFISNGNVMSQQAKNFDFEPIIEKISKIKKNYLFLITKNYQSTSPNVIHTSSITNKENDLVELGFISSKSDVIIGRCSGPYCFAQNEFNLLDESKTFIGFSKLESQTRFYDNLIAKCIHSNEEDLDKIFQIVEENI